MTKELGKDEIYTDTSLMVAGCFVVVFYEQSSRAHNRPKWKRVSSFLTTLTVGAFCP